jgi:predicted amidophosphoribosyltransferase
MPTSRGRSRGRYCPRCRNRISRKVRLCPICGALNLKAVDYLLAASALAGAALVIWRWL